MNQDRALALARRQEQLLARSAELRLRVATDIAPWQPRLAQVDQVRDTVGRAWQWLRDHPEVPAGIAVGVAVLRPRRALRWGWRWGRRAWLGWQLIQRVRLAGNAAPGAPRGSGLAEMVAELTRR